MSKSSDAANAVVNTALKICRQYKVLTLRMQSRTIMLEGTAGRFRPFSMGAWTDKFGETHTSGMADILARPRIPFNAMPTSSDLLKRVKVGEAGGVNLLQSVITVQLWIECKSGAGKMNSEQKLFRAHCEDNGEAFVLVHDDVRPVIDWFEAHGLTVCQVCQGDQYIRVPGERLMTMCRCNPKFELR